MRATSVRRSLSVCCSCSTSRSLLWMVSCASCSRALVSAHLSCSEAVMHLWSASCASISSTLSGDVIWRRSRSSWVSLRSMSNSCLKAGFSSVTPSPMPRPFSSSRSCCWAICSSSLSVRVSSSRSCCPADSDSFACFSCSTVFADSRKRRARSSFSMASSASWSRYWSTSSLFFRRPSASTTRAISEAWVLAWLAVSAANCCFTSWASSSRLRNFST
mmetsp:Transcript_3650/g.5479  ORF Transcript_3650/g.5479 Transcript_3650/m.5479 type:complete len:218 (-) Transcript_3650:438-1091(-)